MAVSKRLRYEIFRRDNHTCRYCGASAPDAPLRVDHVTPVALGGTDTPDNLVTACQDCNSGKSSATTDATLVADVSQDALRWAEAMKEAAANLLEQEKPKHEYRAAFRREWDRWGYGEGEHRKGIDLPNDWKDSVERFRIAGLPAWAWADIVDTSMGNDKVLDPNKFKYCCGIAWNKVTAMQEEARRILGTSQASASNGIQNAVTNAAVAVWRGGMADAGETPTTQQEEDLRRSLALLADQGEDFSRIIQAAEFATFFGITDITVALRDMDRDAAGRAWLTAWPTSWVPADKPWDGKVVGGPSGEQREWAMEQIDKLLDADIYLPRIVRAASHAGTHKSGRIYSGLSDDELKATGVSSWQSKASELWGVAFTASGDTEPTDEERTKFFASLRRIGEDGGFYIADVYEAASAAGIYHDPDVTTCLTRHLSVFEAAAAPVGGVR